MLLKANAPSISGTSGIIAQQRVWQCLCQNPLSRHIKREKYWVPTLVQLGGGLQDKSGAGVNLDD